MGDPAGVGPELCLRLLADERVREYCIPVVFGDLGVLWHLSASLAWLQPDLADVCHVQSEISIDNDFLPGIVYYACGSAAYKYFTKAIDAALAGWVDAIATCFKDSPK